MMFATPALLLLLPAAAAPLVLRWLRASRRPSLAFADLSAVHRATDGRTTWRLRLRAIPDLLRAATVAVLIVALARPQQGLAITTLPEEGIDIVIALDTSSSMEQRTSDIVTRLEAARTVVEEFVSGLKGDRVGLVVFQSRALMLSPLTLDHDALKRAVRAVRSDLLPDGTAIGLGVSEALNLLRDSPARSRVVVLLTDGQNNAGEVEPLDAAQIASALDVRVYTIGFRAGGALTPGVGGIDEATLRRITSITDAAYYDASTERELADAYEAIGDLERSRVGERRFTSFREFAPWLAAAALGLLTIEAALRATVLRRYP
jgi:Ca-activated chloride channel family protein